LNGQTPAEKCGIKIEGNDKWLTIIQNAKKELKMSKDNCDILNLSHWFLDLSSDIMGCNCKKSY
jgi:hypothetical protein